MKKNVTDRNNNVQLILKQFLKEVEEGQVSSHEQWSNEIEVLFQTKTWGFRETLLVICVARLLDENFKASEDFYRCHPRALYEKPIKSFLDEHNIPARQSGPLNVAKSTQKINMQWADNRGEAAKRLVHLVELIEISNQEEVKNFTKLLLARYLQERQELEKLSVNANPQASITFLFHVCKTLIEKAPDQGNTPQRIIGYLLESYHEDLKTDLIVSGHNDRASIASTTSKKLGDITEEKGGNIVTVYEVTVKPFKEQRIREAYEAASSYYNTTPSSSPKAEILVVCQKSDIPDTVEPISEIYLGKFEYQDMIFHFIDIYEWINAQLLRMRESGRLVFFQKLQSYINDHNTAVIVKAIWQELNNNET